MPDESQSASFSVIAPRVMGRVMLRRWVALLGRTGALGAGVIVSLLLAGWFVSGTFVPWLPLVLVALWLIGTGIASYLGRPGAFSALALWDQAANRREAFANAWWFEQQAELTAAQREHVAAQSPLLAEALPGLNAALPVRPARTVWIAPALALLAFALPAVFGSRVVREIVSQDMQETANKEGEKLAKKDWENKKLAGLTEQEKKELEKLKDNVQKTAKDLENSKGKDAREVLADLEKRAREAEKLAAQLGDEKDSWASEKMVQELRKHADTADLGDAVADKKADNAAKAADALAGQLKSPQLTNESRERMNETLKTVQKEADKEDRKRTVGENVLAAGDQMSAAKPAEAGKEFEKLADKMREVARREQTRKELEKLAQQLRDAGSNITGQSSGGMQQMAEAGQQGNSPQSGQSQSQQVPQSNPQQQGQNGSQQQLMPPGLGQNQQQGQMSQSPVPGTGQQQQLQMMAAQPPGQGQDGKGKPTLFAPIPGMKPGEKPDALMLGQGQPDGEPNGSIMLAAPGGLPPGAGTAKLNNEATEKQKSGNQSMVAAQKTGEGQSTFRSVEGGTKKETASRSATATAVEAIQAEEEALDEQALPPSRREQVRRYFTELRKRFEKQD